MEVISSTVILSYNFNTSLATIDHFYHCHSLLNSYRYELLSPQIINERRSGNYRLLCSCHHHHQPINDPTARAQALLMDYTLAERAITHHLRVGGCLLQMQPGPMA
jgi:hypothetical protein